jgi:hypothetical protein
MIPFMSLSLLLTLLLFAMTAPLILYRLKRSRKKKEQRDREIWSIGIYEGPSPILLGPTPDIKNPVFTAQQVTDVKARFVADPFMIKHNGEFHLFFEVLNSKREKGEIGYARSSNLKEWQYGGIVLRERFHLSYPYVFFHDGDMYMLPECADSHEVKLYKATAFPQSWEYASTLIRSNKRYSPLLDPSIVHHKGRWYLFTNARKLNDLHLFSSDTLFGPWAEHPKSPILTASPHFARPAGRVVKDGEALYRYAQDGIPNYGSKVWAFRITELSAENYREEQVPGGPVIGPGIQAGEEGWNNRGMHTVDGHQQDNGRWIALVDGLELKA